MTKIDYDVNINCILVFPNYASLKNMNSKLLFNNLMLRMKTISFPKIIPVFITTLVICLLSAGSVYADSESILPSDPDVQVGNPSIDVTGNDMTIDAGQHNKTWIDWQGGFNIGVPNSVYNYGPSAQAVILHNDVSGDISNIMGGLFANCNVFITNPNGVLFGSSSHVDVPGLVASSLNISKDNFINGNYVFKEYGDKIGASVINQGYIQAKSVALMGQAVKNEGQIVTTLGKTTLASGEKMTLNLDTAGMISIVIDEAVKEKVIQDGEEVKAGVENTGEIEADGGIVILTAKALDNVFDYAVNQEGIIQANAIDTSNGKVVLKANQRVNVAGEINTEGGDVLVDAAGADMSADIKSNTTTVMLHSQALNVFGGTGTGDVVCTDPGDIYFYGDYTVNEASGHSSLTITAKDGGSIPGGETGSFYQDFGLIKTNAITPGEGDINISGYDVTVRAIDAAGDLDVTAENNLIIAPAWNYKEEITIDPAYIDLDLSDFPVLVKLDSSNFDFDNETDDGLNVRFVDSQGHPLSYEIEDWDKAGQEAYIWVKVPDISSSSGASLYMYHDDYSNLPYDSFNDTTDVWSSGYAMVQHGSNEESGVIYDSTSYGNNGTIYGDISGAAGIAGYAGSFNGIDDYVNCGNGNSLNIPDTITIEAWINPDTLSTVNQNAIVSKSLGYWFFVSTTGKLSFLRFNANDPDIGYGHFSAFSTTADILTGTRTHVAATYDTTTGNIVKLYIDGQLSSEGSFTNGAIDSTTTPLTIGEWMGSHFFDGIMDEVRISDTVHSAEWIDASYNIETNPLGPADATSDLATTGLNARGDLTLTGIPTDAVGTPSIQSAIDAIGVVDGTSTINVAAGTYAENVVIPPGKDNLRLLGAGSDVTSIEPISGRAVALNGNLGMIDGFAIQGFTLETTDANYKFIALSGTPNGTTYTKNLELRDIVVNGGQRGICLNAVQKVTLTDVRSS